MYENNVKEKVFGRKVPSYIDSAESSGKVDDATEH